MVKIRPINIENAQFMIHVLRPIDMVRMASIEKDIFEMLNDDDTVQYIPEQKLIINADANKKVTGFVVGYSTGVSFAHFITEKNGLKTIGIVNIISPETAKASYKLDRHDWMVEYYLNKKYWGKGIATGALTAICINLFSQGILRIAAVCQRENISSLRVLEKVGFIKEKPFDFKQDYYILTPSN